jgi:hypothetical protein
MSPLLHEAQVAFAAYLDGRDRPDLVAMIGGDAGTAMQRLQLHRRHYRLSLEAALAETFATVASLVGEAFFGRLARGFIECMPPTGPVLSAYGAAFPDFIEARVAEHGVPYLADVARLDWALNVAFHASIDQRLSPDDLASIPADSLAALSPGLASGSAVLSSAYPLGAIWEAAQPGASDEAVDLASGGTRLLVFRRHDDAAFANLSAGEAALATGFLRGAGIADAAAGATKVDPVFDLAGGLARLLGLGVLTLSPARHEPTQ